MSGLLDGKSVLITGAGGGIGRAAAILAAAEGAKVMIADLNEGWINETAELIRKAGGTVTARRTDVANEADVNALVKATVDAYGRLDGAFNNAGIEGDWGRTAESTLANFDKVIAVNSAGVFLCMKAEILAMLETGGGAIVNTASIAGLSGASYMPAYVASKHAVVGLTKTGAMEYARRNIRVNAVCPGPIETPMLGKISSNRPNVTEAMKGATAMKRLGQPVEIAQAACWLMSDRASFVTGVALPVDGGMIAG
ncbi:MAG: glucose 1-dehydrogenase [Pseudomonadota bacterium]|nr:glucose 1-dehydrogenase [Pseudomonadota bacterium]